MIAYDPNFYAGDADDGGSEEDDGEFDDDDEDGAEAYDDDDDSSWKIRRAALKVIAAIVRSYPQRAQDSHRQFTLPLVERFKEREETVKLDVFTTFAG